MTRYKRTSIFFIACSLFVFLASSALAQTPNFSHTIGWVTQAPDIDGVLTDNTWIEASTQGSKFVVDLHSSAEYLTEFPRVAYAGYNDDALYFAFVVYHPSTDTLVTNPAQPWEADEIEIFLKPDDSEGYHQFIVTSANDKVHRTYGNVRSHNIDFPSATRVDDIKWTVEVAIPFAELGHTPSPGDQWTMNLNGHQYSLGEGFIAWNPTYGRFLNPDRFATITFGQ